MEAAERLSLEQIRAFLSASDEVGFEARNRTEMYGWVNQALCQQRYTELNRGGRGLVRLVPGEDDRAEPGVGHAPDHGASAGRGGETAGVSAAPLPPAVQARRHRFAGDRG